jgi:hypothetical protein
MRLGACSFKRLCAGVRPNHPEDLVARTDEFFHDGGTNESGSAGKEYTHICLPISFQLKLTKGRRLN